VTSAKTLRKHGFAVPYSSETVAQRAGITKACHEVPIQNFLNDQKMFLPEQKSLTQQIAEIIRTVESEYRLQSLSTAQMAIQSLQNTLIQNPAAWTFAEIDVRFNATEGNSITAIRNAAAWLQEPNNQNMDLWGQVLAAQCQAYISFTHVLTVAIASLGSKTPDAVADASRKLEAGFKGNGAIQLAFLRDIRSAARMRGSIWHVGRFTVGNNNRDSGSIYFRDSAKKEWKELESEARVLTITRRHAALDAGGSPYPLLAVFHLEMDKGESVQPAPGPGYRNRKNTNAWGLSGRWPLGEQSVWEDYPEIKGAHDICATPGQRRSDVYLYVAKEGRIERYIQIGRASLLKDTSVSFTTNTNMPVDSVCAVDYPHHAFASDTHIPLDDEWVVYSGWGRDGRRYISVDFASGVSDLFRAPWDDLTGMAVDSKRLWVFNQKLIACVTHAAVKQAIRRMDPVTRALPVNWSRYDVPQDLGDWTIPGYYNGLRDLSSCDDGSLYAVIAGGAGISRIHHAVPAFDEKAHRILIQGAKESH
jgi:hypothetical protein